MKYEEVAPGIILFDNVLKDPDLFINKIESMSGNGLLSWNPAKQSSPEKNSNSYVSKNVRSCEVLNVLKHNEDINKELDSSIDIVLKQYSYIYNCQHWKNNEGWQILKYNVSDHFINHYDDSKAFPRTISMSLCLNDNFSGGDLEFTRFDIKIKPKKNQAIFFPSNYVYSHTVHPVISGTRYAIVAWWE